MINHTQKLSKFLGRWMPVLIFIVIITALFIGYYFSDKIIFLKQIILPTMILMLIPMMMGIVIEELKLVFKDRKIITIAVLMNFIISPLLAYLWAKLFFNGLDPKFIVG